jgi:hypothetical protein
MGSRRRAGKVHLTMEGKDSPGDQISNARQRSNPSLEQCRIPKGRLRFGKGIVDDDASGQWDVPLARERGEISSFLHPLDRKFPMVASVDIGGSRSPRSPTAVSGNRSIAETVPREKWASLLQEEGSALAPFAPRVQMLDGFNSGWIDFDPNGMEHIRGRHTQEEIFRHLLEK